MSVIVHLAILRIKWVETIFHIFLTMGKIRKYASNHEKENPLRWRDHKLFLQKSISK